MQKQSNQTHWYEILKKERKQRSWTQEEVAEKIGVAAKSVGRWESGKNLPIALHRRSLCSIYEKTLHELGLDEELPSYKSISPLTGRNGKIELVGVPTAAMRGQPNRQIWKGPFVWIAGMVLAVVPLVGTVLALQKSSFTRHLRLPPLLLLPLVSLIPQQTL